MPNTFKALRPTIAFCTLLAALTTSADTSWIASSDGLWSDTLSWSSGLPNTAQNVTTISNSGTKTVRLDNTSAVTNRVIQQLSLANNNGSTNTLLIDATELSLHDTLTIGAGGELVLCNGGSLNVFGATETRGSLIVNGGLLNLATNLVLANCTDSTGTVYLLEGELNLSNSNAVLTVGHEGDGKIFVYGGTMHLNADQLIIADRTNSTGFLLVAGGTVITTDISIAHFQGSTGTVLVTAGQLLATNSSLKIGDQGNGLLLLADGIVRVNEAVVSANRPVNEMPYPSKGILDIQNGEMHVTSNLLVNGFLALEGGKLTVDQLYMTNAASFISFSGGSLESGGTHFSNGQPFWIGDGVKPATYHMRGGVHEFANGLIISSNATLSGCGTIIGNVINNGTIATNCTVTPPSIANVRYESAALAFSFQSQAGVGYVIEHKATFHDPHWTTLEVRTGDGSVLTVIDLMAGPPSRFYRIRIP